MLHVNGMIEGQFLTGRHGLSIQFLGVSNSQKLSNYGSMVSKTPIWLSKAMESLGQNGWDLWNYPMHNVGILTNTIGYITLHDHYLWDTTNLINHAHLKAARIVDLQNHSILAPSTVWNRYNQHQLVMPSGSFKPRKKNVNWDHPKHMEATEATA